MIRPHSLGGGPNAAHYLRVYPDESIR